MAYIYWSFMNGFLFLFYFQVLANLSLKVNIKNTVGSSAIRTLLIMYYVHINACDVIIKMKSMCKVVRIPRGSPGSVSDLGWGFWHYTTLYISSGPPLPVVVLQLTERLLCSVDGTVRGIRIFCGTIDRCIFALLTWWQRFFELTSSLNLLSTARKDGNESQDRPA